MLTLEKLGHKKYMQKTENILDSSFLATAIMLRDDGTHTPCPSLMTEEELIMFLRIPQVTRSDDFHNVIAHLKRFHDLPCIHICGQPLYPSHALLEWIKAKLIKEQRK